MGTTVNLYVQNHILFPLQHIDHDLLQQTKSFSQINISVLLFSLISFLLIHAKKKEEISSSNKKIVMKKIAEGMSIRPAPPPVCTFSTMPAAKSTSLIKVSPQDFWGGYLVHSSM